MELTPNGDALWIYAFWLKVFCAFHAFSQTPEAIALDFHRWRSRKDEAGEQL